MTEPFSDALARTAPTFERDLQVAKNAQLYMAMAVIGAENVPRAARLICSLAASDLGDLLDDVSRGAGRSAMRAARSLIEHQVNLHTVLASDEAAERYMDHLHQGPLLMESTYEAHYLDRKVRKSLEHAARKRARKARPLWEAAIARWGNGFARQWHPTNIHDRSLAAGRPDLYEFYRLGSAVAHGSSGGSMGQFTLHDDDVATYGAGRSPALVPFALAVGAEAYLQMLTHLEAKHPHIDVLDNGHMVFRILKEHTTAIQRAVALSSGPELARNEVTTVLAFTPNRATRWYVYHSGLPGGDVWYRAMPTNKYCDAYARWLEPVMREYVDNGGLFNEGNWAAVAVPGLQLTIDWTKQPIPDDAMPFIVRSSDGTWVVGTAVIEGLVLGAGRVYSGDAVSIEALERELDKIDAGQTT